jgi:integrase
MAKVNFTQGRVSTELKCDEGKRQTFHWDSTQPGLGLRITAAGARSYIAELWLHGKSMRITIGSIAVWTLEKARSEASRLKLLTDAGRDPREIAAEDKAAHVARQTEKARQTVTLREAWDAYCAARRPFWSDLHTRDHETLAQPGGEKKVRGKGLTQPGPLAPLMPLRLADLTAKTITGWLAVEAEARPARARLAMNLLRGFGSWAEEQDAYAGLIDPKAMSTKLVKDLLPPAAAKSDVLQREQLAAWFAAVRALDPTMSAYLIGLLLTGARREELAGLKWADVNFQWRSLHLADKIEAAGRTIPLTTYLMSLLLELKRQNDAPPTVRALREQYERRGDEWAPSEYVFSSKKSASGRLEDMNRALSRACAVAGVGHVTLHGLRRSFSTLSEWLELPTGVVAQIMGHKPSATAERHYKVRPLDLLRQHHDRLEAWLLEQAGITFDPEQKAAEPMLRAV